MNLTEVDPNYNLLFGGFFFMKSWTFGLSLTDNYSLTIALSYHSTFLTVALSLR